MNAKEYRAYREEQEYLKEKNRKITLVSDAGLLSKVDIILLS